ncbi:uncharacterized protein FOMMEDRAFT_111741 [Fomitiporia mediterranea MF3/22]|uniref:uncharacterized protein n=1 Tax=Fomitiporia mediterranea (strain MF3/22) TaxID=694068 RepID=UPI0004407A99|nr:uncharacterized protein FOMMEDRAFT_111741 [Fomitiporia mediterranea MF3/22]EJD01706.1 hypothetical protein FOMMEDRAFT_111741 [Fomitiporia mediterranea MF3/22]
MASSSSPRSQLIDITYDAIALIISGHREGTRPDQLSQILEPRIERLQRVTEPFAQPSDASKNKLESGSIELNDGITVPVDDLSKELAFAMSDRFQIDQVEAFVLVRSFLYNEGLPEFPEDQRSSVIEEVMTRITPFYYSERLYIVRTVVALLKSSQTQSDPFHHIAPTLLRKIIPNPTDFSLKLASEFLRKTQLSVPQFASGGLKATSQWAKQNAKEQLVLVELLFWMLWDYCPVNAPIAVAVFQTAYEAEFGYRQANKTSMLDEEGTQLQRDLASLWVLITIETLQLEYLSDTVTYDAREALSEKGPLHLAPLALLKIHRLIIVHASPGYFCTMLAWAFFIKAISDTASRMAERPKYLVPFLQEIRSSSEVTFKKGEKEVHATIVAACLRPEAGLFSFMQELLSSPLFMASNAIRVGSSVTDANDIAYRALLKGLIMSLTDYGPVEHVPDFDGFVEVWIELFGNSESPRCAGLCKQFWDVDWRMGSSRRAILDVVRSRFPVQFRPLIRILRAMSGTVRAQSTDPGMENDAFGSNRAERHLCASYVYHYFRRLPTYTQVIPAVARTGAGALYDRTIERVGSSSASGAAAYANSRPVTLPGGSLLPLKSTGRLLCADSTSDPVVVAWQHEHSGWKLLIDVLIDYVNRRQGLSRAASRLVDSVHSRKSDAPVTLQLSDIGVETGVEDEAMVADALELVLSIIQGNVPQAEQLMSSLEQGGQPVSYTARDAPPPDLVQLAFMILEDALSRAQSGRTRAPTSLIAPALDILSTLLDVPAYRNRVWLSLRSSSFLFGSDRDANFDSVILSTERASGHYLMTLALLRLVRTALEETITSLLPTQQEQPRLQTIKEEVLLRAIRFIHGQIWVEHSGWRYAHLGDRFEIGRSIVALYSRIIQTSSAVESAHTFAGLSAFVTDVLLYQATASTVTPLVHTIASGRTIVDTLASMRRFSESIRFTALLGDSLHLTRLVLYLKTISPAATKHTVLEQALCTDHSAGGMLMRARKGRVNPVDMLAHYVKQRELGLYIPREAARSLTALCTSLSACTPSPPSLIQYLSDAQATMASLVKILRHPYDDLELRNALWAFVCAAVEKQPALAVLFVAGQFRIHPSKGKGKAVEGQEIEKLSELSSSMTTSASAVEAACATLSGWKELWEANPQLLASVMSFLNIVWNRSLEHLATLEPTRGDVEFWKHIAAITREELGPAPDYFSGGEIETEEGTHSDLHEAVQNHAYRTKIKSHALRILGSDIVMHLRSGKEASREQPTSYKEAASVFQNGELLTEAISEAIFSSYDPTLYDQLTEVLKTSFEPLTFESLRPVEPLNERDFGDNFMLSVRLLRDVLRTAFAAGGEKEMMSAKVQLLVYSVNLNMSLAHSQLFLAESWRFLLDQMKGYLRGNNAARTILLATAVSASRDIAREQRSGDFMSNIHGGRLQVLLALLEAAWFSTSETTQQTKSFMSLLENVGSILTSEAFPPGRSFIGSITNPFHRSLLQIVYYCAKNCQQLTRSSQDVKAEHRLLMSRTFTTVLLLVIDALRLSFDIARTRLDLELDRDMELLVAVFQQCTRQGLHTSSNAWLTRCQETEVINTSLMVLTQADISGFSDLDLLRIRGQPLYAPQVLSFHMALASTSFTAERLASESVIAAYCNNSISVALSEGQVDTALPELPGERSPAHKAYCLMLANLTGMISNLASPQQFIESQVVGFVQLYGQQLSRCLSWSNDDPLTLPFLEELELTVELFYLMASGTSSSNTSRRESSPISSVSRSYVELALLLVQQLNYALTHPKHLSGLLEPVTGEERVRIDRETSDGSVTSLNELLDGTKRPILANVVRRLFGVTTNVISTLSIIGGAETVLLNDPEEWPIREAVVVPHSKVTMGEPASIGTLLELGNCSYESLHFLANKKTNVLPASSVQAPKVPQYGDIRIYRQALETVLVYASTQLVMWLSKHDGEQTGEMELDESQQPSEGHGYGLKADVSTTKDRERERRLRRKSLTLADRLRRGMTGEMTMDLQALVAKAKDAIAASSEILATPEPGDLLQVLATFLEDRVAVSS